ncbi:MAG: 5-nucleotidase, partial [Myxococcaceae bacterium]|nr:5-nucleotidase [Myxococcaceae bacterium]
EMFDFVARRSAGRGCVSQAQVAGARVRMNCKACNRPGPACSSDAECLIGASGCDLNSHTCVLTSCAEEVYIGTTAKTCTNDAECAGDDGVVHPGHCDVNGSLRCFSRISDTNLYELATSNYLAGGGSGFRTLQRNTTQFDTKVQQRDALIDYLRQGKPCGFKLKTDDKGKPVIPKTPLFPTAEGLKACATDGDCASEGDNFACACPNPSLTQRRQDIPLDDPAQELHVRAINTPNGEECSSQKTTACDPGVGRCVLKDCRTQVAAFHNRRCTSSPAIDACKVDLDACSIGGETCKLLSCVDRTSGAFTDNRLEMVGK